MKRSDIMSKVGQTARRRRAPSTSVAPANVVLEEARRAGLLDGDRTEHLSFRATQALIKAAQRATGVSSPTELGILALAMLAQPDPVAAFLKRTRGALGESHSLDV
jgi:hypothetical protein